MKKILSLAVAALLCVAALCAQTVDHGHGLQEYKLSNGLTVYLWEDHSVPDVHGRVVVRAGSVDEPGDYTGLAHYLEHMMFKGTQEIGTLDWEKEQPLYNEIIELYNELNAYGKAHENDKPSKKEDPARLDIIKRINEKSLEAAQYGATNDFSNLTESYGGDNLNAFTSYDLTAYHNDFPATAMEKWMKLNSDRLMNPVFRSFQAELENVFEEYNMYNDDMGTHQRQFMFEHLYGGTPYDRDVIGYAKDLKNPSLQALINFYNTWYVPNNMVLLLVGNFNAEQAKPLIETYFGRLTPKELPERPTYPKHDFSQDKKAYKLNVGYMPQYIWAYQGLKMGDKESTALEFALALLNNSHETGLLDKLMLDGTVGGAYAQHDSRRIDGRLMVIGVPYYDMATRSFDDAKTTEKLIYKEIDKIMDPEKIPDWLFNSVKKQLLQEHEMMYEYQSAKINILTYAYTYDIPLDEFINEDKEIAALTKEQVAAVAKKYFDAPRCTLEFGEGEPQKNKLAKPAIKPLDPPKGVQTEYAKAFKNVPTTAVNVTYNDFSEVTHKEMSLNVNLHYTENTQNDIFTVTLRYGVGTHLLPKLEYAAALMNTAGCVYEGKVRNSQELHRLYSELGATYSFGVNDSYFYISIQGEEKNLDKIMSLVVPQIMFTDLDDKQIKSMVSNAYWGRFSEKRSTSVLSSALLEYILYGENSRYIDRIPMSELYHYNVLPDGSGYDETFLINKTNLTTTIQEATGYALDIFYCGKKPIAEVEAAMQKAPMQKTMLATQSPFFRNRSNEYNQKTQVIFLHDARMQQAKVYFYSNGTNYDCTQDVNSEAFNQYFSGGFSGLVMNEIREKRSMAYTAYGQYVTPSVPNRDSYMIGYIGTQSDKVPEAINVMMDLMTNMPDPEDVNARMADIKEFLYQSTLAAKPNMRSKSQVYEAWLRAGYTDDPAKTNLTKIENLTYDQIKNYYEQNIKGRPITIVVIGDQKMMDKNQVKELQKKYGKFVKISNSKLFKGGVDEL